LARGAMGYSETLQTTGNDTTGEPGFKQAGRESPNGVNRAGTGWFCGGESAGF
jgi:hypothetical protein